MARAHITIGTIFGVAVLWAIGSLFPSKHDEIETIDLSTAADMSEQPAPPISEDHGKLKHHRKHDADLPVLPGGHVE